jgi:hypothetical protein
MVLLWKLTGISIWVINITVTLTIHEFDYIVNKFTRYNNGTIFSWKNDHFVRYFCNSRSVKKPFSFHEMINFTKWLRHIYTKTNIGGKDGVHVTGNRTQRSTKIYNLPYFVYKTCIYFFHYPILFGIVIGK